MKTGIKKLLLLSFLFIGNGVFAQDLFGYESSLKYTDYLIQKGDYVSSELELNTMESTFGKSDTITLLKLKCFRLSGQKDASISIIKSIIQDSLTHHEYLVFDAMRTAIQFKTYQALPPLISHIQLTTQERERLYFFSFLLLNDTSNARIHLNNISDNDSTCSNLFNGLRNLPRLKTSTGVLLSIFPGAGAIYAKQKHAGLTNTTIVTLFSWLSYRGFTQKGTGSIYGWFYATGASVFYVSGIYSVPKNIRRYNHYIFSNYQDEVKHAFENTLIR